MGFVEDSDKLLSSEPFRLLFELGVLGVLTNPVGFSVFRVGREPVEVDLLGQKPRRPPNTAVNRPQLVFLSGEVSPITVLLWTFRSLGDQQGRLYKCY